MPPYDQPYGGTTQRIKDLQFNVFATLHVQVVKFFDTGSWVVLDVTDYTRNEHLPVFAQSAYNTNAAEGQFALRVECHAQNAEFARRSVRVGAWLRLKNCRIKRSNGGLMEATVWGAKNGFVDIELLQDNAIIKEIEGRRRGLRQPPTGPNRDRRRRTGEDRGRNEVPRVDSNVLTSRSDNGTIPELAPATDSSVALMPCVKLSADALLPAEMPPTPFKELSATKCFCQRSNRQCLYATASDDGHSCVPYLNSLHTAVLRVVDFFPHDVRDFTVLEDGEWKWNFELYVVDGTDPHSTEAVRLLITHEDAQELLNRAPCSFRDDENESKMLSYTLSLLWGNLEEAKIKWNTEHGSQEDVLDMPVYKRADFPQGFASYNEKSFKGCVAEVGLSSGQRNSVDMPIFDHALFLRHTRIRSRSST